MSRVIIALIIVLLPILATAQTVPVPPVPVYPNYPIIPVYQRTFLNLEVRPGYQGASYSFKDQDISLKTSGGILEFGASLITPGRCKLSGYLTTARDVSEPKTILGSFVVGATEFGEKPATNGTGGTGSASKSVLLDFKADPGLRFEITSMIPNLQMQPLVVFQRSGYSITATSTDGGTTQKRDTERSREWDTAIGAECPIYGPGWLASVKAAAGMDLVFVSFGYTVRWDRQIFLGFNVDHQRINYDRGIRRYTAGFLRIGAEF